ncbi:hypothetical protein CCR83_00110 [Rhodobacter veldkampii DSM 11550]|uniref:Uncharacterized protein n=1 Tax=Phaeovulum veldkampii DSM 11550 TaxID=1185920 RepID=A0A2T4JAG9_9RHOB|nr:hypothetical protein [Phaeovulum veldkampii DSM 11550]PTE14892.1 hypothetical protein C5F46_14445 [Phaeovulum veldkampii DSM 11550]
MEKRSPSLPSTLERSERFVKRGSSNIFLNTLAEHLQFQVASLRSTILKVTKFMMFHLAKSMA